jgi:hypothetical protein
MKRKIYRGEGTLDSMGGIGKSHEDGTRTTKVVCYKHLSGMCGVNKFLVIWKEKTSDKCPGCGQHEGARHKWSCPAQEATNI